MGNASLNIHKDRPNANIDDYYIQDSSPRSSKHRHYTFEKKSISFSFFFFFLFFFNDRREVTRKSRLINSVRTCTLSGETEWKISEEEGVSNRVTRYNFNEFLDDTNTDPRETERKRIDVTIESRLRRDEVTNERMKTAKGTKEGIGCFRFENSRFD